MEKGRPTVSQELQANREKLLASAETFWKNYLEEYFTENNEYPPLFDERNVEIFITQRNARDAGFRQGAAQFDLMRSDFVKIGVKVYHELTAKNKNGEGK